MKAALRGRSDWARTEARAVPKAMASFLSFHYYTQNPVQSIITGVDCTS